MLLKRKNQDAEVTKTTNSHNHLYPSHSGPNLLAPFSTKLKDLVDQRLGTSCLLSQLCHLRKMVLEISFADVCMSPTLL